jgi:vancomycin resistance protein VanK
VAKKALFLSLSCNWGVLPLELVKVESADLNNFSHWLEANPKGEVFQSVEWANLKSDTWQAEFYYIKRQEQVIGACTIHLRRLPVINRQLLYLPRGPVFKTYDWETMQDFTEIIKAFAKSRGAAFVKCDPPVMVHEEDQANLAQFGYVPLKTPGGFGGYEPAATIMLDMSGSQEEVFLRIPKKTRYNIRYSQKNGVTYGNVGSEGLDDFIKILQDTSKRANFFVRTRDHYGKILAAFQDRAQLTLAYYNGLAIAGGITLLFGDKAYAFTGGQLTEYKHLRAFYGLIWERMLWAKSQGAQVFDLYGIPVDRSEKNRLHGLYAFKKSFGGEEYDYIGEYDLPINKPLYQAWRLMSGAQASLARMRRRFLNRLGR